MLKKGLAVGVFVLFLIISVIPNVNGGNSSFKSIVPSDTPKINNIIYVDDDGGADYTRIQDAIDNASDRDTIYIHSGTYYECRIKVNKTLSLIGLNYDTRSGNDTGKPIVNANNSGHVFSIQSDNCNFEGIITKNPGFHSTDSQAGFVISAKYCTIMNCSVFGNFYTGIYLKPKRRANNAVIFNNTIGGGSRAIRGIYMPYEPAGGSENINVSKNRIYNVGHSIEFNGGKNNTLFNNQIHHNTRGIWFVYGGNSNIINNNISNNDEHGIKIIVTDYNDYQHNIAGNIICSNGGHGIYLGDSYRNTICNNVICYNKNNGISILQSKGGCSDSSNIDNNTILLNKGFQIYANGEPSNKISYNKITDNIIHGDVALWYSDGNTIKNNNFLNGGLVLEDSSGNTISNNLVNNKTLIYYEGVHSSTVENAGQVILVNCQNIIIENQDLSNVYVGIQLFHTTGCIVSNNMISNNTYGIHILRESNGNNVDYNSILNNNWGVTIVYSNNNVISKNNFKDNGNHALFSYGTGNIWQKNYWGKARILPYPIIGNRGKHGWMLWVNFDWHPAQEPYDIS